MARKSEAKEWARERMKGLWTSPMIPFTDDGALDEDGIRQNVEYMLASKADGMGFGFSEPWYCTLEERKRAMEVFVDAVRGRVPCYVHATDHSVAESINLVRHAQAVGADAVMMWAPYEFARSEEMACQYYEYVASQTDIALILYNTPHSGLLLSPQAIQRLAALPQACALKDAVNDFTHTVDVYRRVGQQIVVSDPLEEHLLVSMAVMDQQVLLGTTSVFLMQSPHCQPIHDYVELAKAGRMAEAWEQYFALEPLRERWNDMYRVLWGKAAMHPIPTTKYWMDLIGMRGGPVRPPMTPVSEEAKAQLRADLLKSGWMERLHPSRTLEAAL